MERKIHVVLNPSQQAFLLELLMAEKEHLETDLEKALPDEVEQITKKSLGDCEQLINLVHGATSEGVVVR